MAPIIVLITLVLAALPAPQQAPAAPSSQLGEWIGRVQTGGMAIGGETTGVRLVTEAGTFELSADGAIATRLRELNGQQITLRGRLIVRPGIERRERRVITVIQIRRPTPWTERPAGDLLFLSFSRGERSARLSEKITALPAALREELNRRVERRRIHLGRLAPKPAGRGLLEAVAQSRRQLEASLVGFAGTPAAAEAAAYAKTAKLSYEWEGFPDGPMDEAAVAIGYVAKHPDSVLRPYLELFTLHRLRAAFEAGGFSSAFPPADMKGPVVSGFSRVQRDAADTYRGLVDRLRRSPDALTAALAADLDDALYVYIDIAAHPRDASSRTVVPAASVPLYRRRQ